MWRRVITAGCGNHCSGHLTLEGGQLDRQVIDPVSALLFGPVKGLVGLLQQVTGGVLRQHIRISMQTAATDGYRDLQCRACGVKRLVAGY